MLRRVLGLLLIFGSYSANAADTVLKLYRPFGDVQEQVQPVVKLKIAGECLGQSKILLRADAWHCRADDKTYDPCFINASGSKLEALCPQSPWRGDSVLIQLKSPLEEASHIQLDMSRALPWGIELSNGEFCQAILTQEIFDSMPIRYSCGNQRLLFGHLQRCNPEWSMLEKTSEGVQTVVFKKVWF